LGDAVGDAVGSGVVETTRDAVLVGAGVVEITRNAVGFEVGEAGVGTGSVVVLSSSSCCCGSSVSAVPVSTLSVAVVAGADVQ